MNLAADTVGGERRRSEAARTAGARVRLMARPAYMCGAAGRSAEVRPRRQQVRYWRPQPRAAQGVDTADSGDTRPGHSAGRAEHCSGGPAGGRTWGRDISGYTIAMGN